MNKYINTNNDISVISMAIVIRDKILDRFLTNVANDLSKNRLKRATKMDALRAICENYKTKDVITI